MIRTVYLPACLLLLVAACAPPADTLVTLDGATMGTQYQVKYLDDGLVDEARLRAEIDNRLAAINASMSTWIADSELSRLNAAPAGQAVPVSDELYEVLRAARRIHRQSGGAFDVTVGPLVNLWGFGPGDTPRARPDEAAVAAALERVGMARLKLDPDARTVTRETSGMYVDLSAIAKGYAVDEVAKLIAKHGLAGFMVEIGGEVRTHGVNAGGGPWRIGIETPLPGQRSVQRVVELEDTGFATSGDYRNFFEQDGTRYSHTLDPRTGYPVTHALASVSVRYAPTMRADAIATAMMVLGPIDGMRVAEERGWPVLMLIHDGEGFVERTSSTFDGRQDGG
ncbi:MAG: FAD:protein FMN transferase [Gammaproteobacteria bacterium]|nr:FAD:protein FMN transferase [Gammaproteobacteria bacterium]NNM01029.1 FAD:protein FMN transferase [Gammaproteobacteria bacterium]